MARYYANIMPEYFQQLFPLTFTSYAYDKNGYCCYHPLSWKI